MVKITVNNLTRLILLALLVLGIGNYTYQQIEYRNVNKIITPYFTAIANKDWDKAHEVCTGSAAYNLESAKDRASNIKKVPVNIAIKDITKFKNAIRAGVYIEIGGNTPNIYYYLVDLIETNNQLKIYRVAEMPLPLPTGTQISIDEKELQNTFVNYLIALKDNQLDKAIAYTTGQARNTMLNSKEILKAGALINDFENVNITCAHATRKYAIANIQYVVDNRATEVLVNYYRPKDGKWLIADVANIH